MAEMDIYYPPRPKELNRRGRSKEEWQKAYQRQKERYRLKAERKREEEEQAERERQQAWRDDLKRKPWKLLGYSGVWMLFFVTFFSAAVVMAIANVSILVFYILILAVPTVVSLGVNLWLLYTDRMDMRDVGGGSMPSSGVEWGRLANWYVRGATRWQMRKMSRW